MSVLDVIVEGKRMQFGNEQFRSRRDAGAPGAASSRFLNAISSDGIRIIGEVKPKSPSAGKLLEADRLNQILEIYKENCAAISVLTDETHFGGSFQLLKQVKQITGLPVLCKDFIVSETQMALAKDHGADAVLLIAKILSRAELVSLINTAKEHGLAPVVEINDRVDLEKIQDLNLEIVLINNRNLDTMQIDLNTTGRIASLLPSQTTIISASGIKTANDITNLSAHANCFLIGTSIMQSNTPSSLLEQLVSARSPGSARIQPASPKIKICGITSIDDANLAINAGANYIGLIFAETSARKISIENALQIVSSIPRSIPVAGVFQNQSIEEINSITNQLSLDYVQLHGTEDNNFIEQCAAPTIKAITSDQLDQASQYASAKFLLLDHDKRSNAPPNLESLAKFLAPIRNKLPPIFLAGRLTPDNVRQAIETINPYAVDVASGIEISPGIKSQVLTNQFCIAAKLAPQVVTI